MQLTTVECNRWKQRRRVTTISFMIESLLIGMEYSVTFLTLWVYINDLVKPKLPKVYYGIVSSAYLISSVIFSVLIGRAFDHYRNTRTFFFIANTMVIIGNIVYALPFSPWLLVAGRFISGGGGMLRSVMAGEIARCYTKEEQSSKFASMGMAFSLGFIAGPAANFAFKTVDIWIGSWHITYANIPGIYMAVIFIILQIICIFMVHDVSKQYDLKQDTIEQTNDDEEEKINSYVAINYEGSIDNSFERSENIAFKPNTAIGEEEPLLGTSKEESSICSEIRSLVSHFDTALLIVVSFFLNYFLISFDIWLPMLVIDKMHWIITDLNGIVFGTGSVCTLTFLIFTWKPLSDKNMFILAVISTASCAIIESIFIVLSYYNKRLFLNIIMWCIFVTAFAVLVIMEEVFLVACFAKLVSSRIQTFSESYRRSASRLGALIAFSSSALMFQWILYVGCLYIFIICILVCLLINRRKVLMNPEVIIK